MVNFLFIFPFVLLPSFYFAPALTTGAAGLNIAPAGVAYWGAADFKDAPAVGYGFCFCGCLVAVGRVKLLVG